MAIPYALSPEARRDRLDELTRLNTDGDQLDSAQLLERFLPLPVHDRALSRDVMVVRGERGAGKSMLFKTLTALKEQDCPVEELFARAEDLDVTWVEGFSEHGTSHPHTDAVARFVDGAAPERLRVMWMAHLVGRVAEELGIAEVPGAFAQAWGDRNDIASWVDAADSTLAKLMSWLDGAHQTLAASGREVVVLYDHLDKIGITSPRVREKATASLLALWLSLSNRYRALRAKIFVREDLFEASLSGSADASKLRSRSVALTWDIGALYRVLIRHMAAQSEEMRDWIQSTTNGIPLDHRTPFGWFPPDMLRETGRPSYAVFIEHLAGRQMGKGPKKGYVYRWIPDRLQDARGAIVPRSLLNLIAYAAKHARQVPKAGYTRLLHPYDLQAALEKTSKQRVDELAEEQPVVHRLHALEGITVPVEHAKLVARLSRPAKNDDSYGEDARAVVEELAAIGVLRDRGGGRWDVPDIYRYGYGIKRRGGPPRPV